LITVKLNEQMPFVLVNATDADITGIELGAGFAR